MSCQEAQFAGEGHVTIIFFLLFCEDGTEQNISVLLYCFSTKWSTLFLHCEPTAGISHSNPGWVQSASTRSAQTIKYKVRVCLFRFVWFVLVWLACLVWFWGFCLLFYLFIFVLLAGFLDTINGSKKESVCVCVSMCEGWCSWHLCNLWVTKRLISWSTLISLRSSPLFFFAIFLGWCSFFSPHPGPADFKDRIFRSDLKRVYILNNPDSLNLLALRWGMLCCLSISTWAPHRTQAWFWYEEADV